jgi:hypothetical protein
MHRVAVAWERAQSALRAEDGGGDGTHGGGGEVCRRWDGAGWGIDPTICAMAARISVRWDRLAV